MKTFKHLKEAVERPKKISSTEYSFGGKFIIQKMDKTWSVYDKSTLNPDFDLAKELSVMHKTVNDARITISFLNRRKK